MIAPPAPAATAVPDAPRFPFGRECPFHPPSPPDLGEDTAAVLGELGYDDAAIARLRERGAV